jgi:hypothetical protein
MLLKCYCFFNIYKLGTIRIDNLIFEKKLFRIGESSFH